MIFYDCATAPSPRRARMALAEKGLTPEVRAVALAEGEQFSDGFLAVNPRATVPVLVTDDGTVLTENLGIAAYLEAVQPEPPLLGRTPEDKGLVMMWTAICEMQGVTALAEVLRNSSPRMAGRALPGPRNLEQIPELAERGRIRLADFFDLLETRLQESPYLAGAEFSLADITGYVFATYARVVRQQPEERHVALRDWIARINDRPSAAA